LSLTIAVGAMFIATGAFLTSVSYEVRAADYDDMVDSISASRISANIQALQDFGSREFHLNNSDDVAQYIQSQFESAGLETELQEFDIPGTNLSNVVATLPGRSDEAGAILFGAHYDSENKYVSNLSEAENLTAPGADDDASGVAAVIEMAHALSGLRYEQTIKFVAFAAEEYGFDYTGGLAGSAYFATKEKENGVNYTAVAIVDMIGYSSLGENKAYVITNLEHSSLAEAMVTAVSTYQLDLNLTLLVNSGIRYSDHLSFWNNGYPGLLVIEEIDKRTNFPVNPYYHSSGDLLERLSLPQLTEVSKAILGGALALLTPVEGTSIVVIGAIVATVAVVAIVLGVYMYRGRKQV
jgi:Zn-dependent M28 family amino/carboxypeptidase